MFCLKQLNRKKEFTNGRVNVPFPIFQMKLSKSGAETTTLKEIVDYFAASEGKR